MKNFLLLFVIILISCNRNRKNETVTVTDSIPAQSQEIVIKEPITVVPKTYSNERFKDVTIEKTGEHQFTITGKAQVFEANFSWVVEDGHEELKKGFQMTDAGAPEWGNFKFSIDVAKKQENSTLRLILFEASAKDGSRQYELPIVLY
ncbi:MAG: Gmad2 immunoglobulin-like domain-containing protein [Bacteroidota bacterium]